MVEQTVLKKSRFLQIIKILQIFSNLSENVDSQIEIGKSLDFKGSHQKKVKKKTSHILRTIRVGQQILMCVNLKKVVIFSYLELKNGHFWSVIGLRSMDLEKVPNFSRL